MEWRHKNRGGGKVMAPKPHKPFSESAPKDKTAVGRKTLIAGAGKENTRSVSAGRAAAVRWSTSSMPKSKVPNPSDFSRATISSKRKSLSGTVKSVVDSSSKEKDGNFVRGTRVLERCKGQPVKKEQPKILELNPSVSVRSEKVFHGFGNDNTEVRDSSNVIILNCNGLDELDSISDNTKNSSNCDAGTVKENQTDESSSVLDQKIQIGESEQGENSYNMVSKNSSKLHEKLAFLEGKVQKIALEIKRTKEMLDHNNTDESKLILTDMQSKLSSIPSRDGQNSNFRPSAKTLSNEELEERFFPHHKLLRNRRSTQPDQNSTATNGEESGYSAAITDSKTHTEEVDLLASEKFEEFDGGEESKPMNVVVQEENEESCENELHAIGHKSATSGWFVLEGEAVLLSHDDNSCSYYDIANSEFKTEYRAPTGVPNNMWGDCWLVRAPGSDGCSGRYVVAASACTSLDSGFCSWDFYTREITSFHIEKETTPQTTRPVLTQLTNTGGLSERNHEWWYRPCGPLLVSTASRKTSIRVYDIRDGELVMNWEMNGTVLGMEYCSPLQWRSRGKLVVAGTDGISLWDVNSREPQPLLSVGCGGKRVFSLLVNNTDGELGGGVRQRASLSEAEGNDGVFCTQESINILDFREPTGLGLKLPKNESTIPHSIFSRGDSIFTGCTENRLSLKGGTHSSVKHYSIRKGKLVATYEFPESNSHMHHCLVTQVWGNSDLVMGVCGLGLFVFDAWRDDLGFRVYSTGVKESIGPDDLYCPTFDYLGSRVLLVSKDRPALWRYLF